MSQQSPVEPPTRSAVKVSITYQLRYVYYLAIATEAFEHRERAGLLMQALCVICLDSIKIENHIKDFNQFKEFVLRHNQKTRASNCSTLGGEFNTTECQ